jgi:DNA-binding NarL/FixJ family response regulator
MVVLIQAVGAHFPHDVTPREITVKLLNWELAITNMLRILVADDSATWTSYLVAKLGENSNLCVVGVASDGLEAVQKAGELRPDLILMDINLPKMSGIQAVRKIREMFPESRILFVSQILDRDIVRAALAAGGTGYVAKLDAETDLFNAVAAVMVGKCFLSSQIASEA